MNILKIITGQILKIKMNKITLKQNKIIKFTRLNLKKLNKQYLNNGNTKYLYNQQKLKILTEKIRFNNIG
jgi:hypothetical protein